MRELSAYLDDCFGAAFKAIPIGKQELGTIPLYLKGNFTFYTGSLNKQSFIWANVPDTNSSSPFQLEKQSFKLKQLLKSPIVFVFDQLDSWQRKRLIERNLAFVQPGKQIYIPELFLQLSDINRSENLPSIDNDKLSAPAQFAVLYHLQVNNLEHKLFQEIAGLLEYSSMTVTRVIKELSLLDLISIEGTKEKSIQFKMKGRALWQQVMPLMNSPVREVWYSDKINTPRIFMVAGESALSEYSMLASPQQKTFAIGKDQFRKLKFEGSIKGFDKKYGDEKIEVWHYDPQLLAKKKQVDKLSLVLSMSMENDERVDAALNELINKFQWL
ncbi:MAG: hypothetical protein NTZ19_10885 [Bacteroidetes bacterium]|nr:hypothetical protein [Bacteroidota bacterium]